MSNKATSLMDEHKTRAMGLQLKEYAKDMYVFNEFRGFKPEESKFTDMEELRAKLETMLKYVAQLPAVLAVFGWGRTPIGWPARTGGLSTCR